MDLKEILKIIDRFEQSVSISDIEVKLGGDSIKLSKSGEELPVAAVSAKQLQKEVRKEDDEFTIIKAPLVGTFFVAASPEDEPLAPVGSVVEKGQTLCIIEAMKMMSEVPSPEKCIIKEIIAENGTLVGFGDPLFKVDVKC